MAIPASLFVLGYHTRGFFSTTPTFTKYADNSDLPNRLITALSLEHTISAVGIMDLIGSGHISFLAIVALFTILAYRWVLRRYARSTAESDGANKASLKDGNTFRVSGVPASWDRQQLQSFLEDQKRITNAAIESLAYENDGNSKVATVTFGNAPSRLQHGRGWPILIPEVSDTKPNRKQYLTVDKDFYGITALYTPSLQDHKVE